MSIIRLNNLSAKQHMAISIGNRSMITTRPVASSGPTLEIGIPYVIGMVGANKWLETWAGTSAVLTMAYQSVKTKNPVASTYRWPFLNHFPSGLRGRHQFSRSPCRMSFLSLYQSCHDFYRYCPGHSVWRSGFIIKPGHPFVSKTS
jgi:hypothetical protein